MAANLSDRKKTGVIRLPCRRICRGFRSPARAVRKRLYGSRRASCAAVLTAVLGLWALAAENRAALWRGESENLVDFLTFDMIHETAAWLPSGKRASVSERVREYYERWEPAKPRAAFAHAINLNQLGSGAEHLAGDWERAVDFVTQASDILKTLHEREPDNLIRLDPDDSLYLMHKSLIGEYRTYAQSEKRNNS